MGTAGLDPVGRKKNLPFIHFIPAESTAGGDVAKSPHQGIDLLPIAGLSGELQQPFPKSRVERPPLGAGDLPGLLNEVVIGTKSNVLHTNTRYTIIVCPGVSA